MPLDKFPSEGYFIRINCHRDIGEHTYSVYDRGGIYLGHYQGPLPSNLMIDEYSRCEHFEHSSDPDGHLEILSDDETHLISEYECAG